MASGMLRWRRRVGAVAVGIAIMSPSTAAAAPVSEASTTSTSTATTGTSTTVTVRGTAVCASGRGVVGVRIESSIAGSAVATLTAMPGKPNVGWFTLALPYSGTATDITPVVGCGGTGDNWASSSRPATVTISSDYIYNVRCSDGGDRTCTPAPLARRNSRNWFYAGQCTWGAAEMWKKSTGTYPSWGGDARLWADNARTHGFRVSRVPHAGSLVIWPAGTGGAGSMGHVAWVKSVWVNNGVTYFKVREMNRTGLWQWSERQVRLESYMEFIGAPPGAPVEA